MTAKKIQAATEKVQASRRNFMRRAAYVPPAILTLAVAPSFAKAGSGKGPPTGVPKGPGKSKNK
jgi:hypothetical protein